MAGALRGAEAPEHRPTSAAKDHDKTGASAKRSAPSTRPSRCCAQSGHSGDSLPVQSRHEWRSTPLLPKILSQLGRDFVHRRVRAVKRPADRCLSDCRHAARWLSANALAHNQWEARLSVGWAIYFLERTL